MIRKSDDCNVRVLFVDHRYDYRLNWTSQSHGYQVIITVKNSEKKQIHLFEKIPLVETLSKVENFSIWKFPSFVGHVVVVNVINSVIGGFSWVDFFDWLL